MNKIVDAPENEAKCSLTYFLVQQARTTFNYNQCVKNSDKKINNTF